MLGGIDCGSKADALRPRDDRGVHADDVPARIDQRSAGVSGIQRGVRLNDVVDEVAGLRAQRAAKRTDDTCRHRGLQTVRISKGDDELSGANRCRIGERRMDEIVAGDPDDGEIRCGIVADQLGIVSVPIERRNGDFFRAVHYVAVGQREAVRRDDESRARAATAHGRDIDADDGRARDVDGVHYCFGIRIERRRFVPLVDS